MDERRAEAINVFISSYFTNTINLYGKTARGADWRDADAQRLRFEQVIKLFPSDLTALQKLKVADFGCGYGAFLEYLDSIKVSTSYLGIDCTEAMIAASQDHFKNRTDCRFICTDKLTEPVDYTVVSGTLNYKSELKSQIWQEYVISCLNNINQYSTKGFAFNLLTSYSDADKMRDHLYYANPSFYFDFCKTNFAKNVALLHDYGAYEFTILVRK